MRRLTYVSSLLIFVWIGWRALHPPLPVVGAPPTLYANQCRDDFRLLFRRAVESAHESIYLMIYNFSDETLLRLLEKKGREGVEVVVVTGVEEARRLKKRLPSVEILPRPIKGRMHQKVVVVDGHQLWIGSANWTTTSLCSHGNLLLGMEAPEFAEELRTSAVSRVGDLPPPPLSQRSFNCGGQRVEYWQLPTEREALGRLLELINSAERRIAGAIFTWTHPEITEAMIAAHLRGVRVELVVDGYAAHGTSRGVILRLQEVGVPVRISLGPELLHHKFLWVDEQTLLMGSANWTRAAFAENDDAFLLLSPLTGAQLKKMKQVWRAIWLEARVEKLGKRARLKR